MSYELQFSSTFRRAFRRLPADRRRHIFDRVQCLVEDPLTARPGADIKSLRGTDPVRFRLRVGSFRIVYSIVGDIVMITELFTRGRGYRE